MMVCPYLSPLLDLMRHVCCHVQHDAVDSTAELLVVHVPVLLYQLYAEWIPTSGLLQPMASLCWAVVLRYPLQWMVHAIATPM